MSSPVAEPRRPSPTFTQLLGRAVHVRPAEIKAMLLSFALFFSVLYYCYILRSIRDEMGVALGRDNLQFFSADVLFVMLATVPAFGWIVTTGARSRLVPLVYGFLILNLAIFWLAGTFFFGIDVCVLSAVSLFWSFMSAIWASEQAKRLHGFVSVGGTFGATTGPVLLDLRIKPIGLANPSMRTRYTVVDPEDEYRSQNFIDTFVCRGREAATGFVFNALTRMAGVTAPVALALGAASAWFWLSFDLGRRQASQAADGAGAKP